MVSRTLKEEQIEPAAGIGYTALAAVLDRPDPTRGTVTSNTQQTTVTANMPEGPLELPPLPSVPFMERSGGGSLVSHREIPSFGSSEVRLSHMNVRRFPFSGVRVAEHRQQSIRSPLAALTTHCPALTSPISRHLGRLEGWRTPWRKWDLSMNHQRSYWCRG